MKKNQLNFGRIFGIQYNYEKLGDEQLKIKEKIENIFGLIHILFQRIIN